MFAPTRAVPQLPAPVVPWTETTVVDLGERGRLTVRHTPGIAASTTMPVVLLHGITLVADVNFFALADLFGADRPAITFDLPNHGTGIRVDEFTFDAAADDVVAVLDQLGVERAVVCGYSLGGITAMVIADRHPRRVAGVVVQAAAMRYGVAVRERLFLQSVAAVHRLRLDQATRTLPARYWRASGRTSVAAAARWSWVRQQLSVTGRIQQSTVWDAVRRADHRGLRSSAPTAVLVLKADRVCPPKLQRETAKLLRGRRFDLEADHDLPVADPSAYASITDEALRWVFGSIAEQDAAR
ncbi:alpha/beta fold hydrolase [Williamsia maris]|nr:alpha/beta fold hydrolase [Williamsia maris]